MKQSLALALVLALATIACGTTAKETSSVDPKTEEQKTLYALGLAMSENLAPFNLTDADLPYIQAGLADGALKRTRKVELSVYGPKLREMAQTRSAATQKRDQEGAGAEKTAGAEFLSRTSLEKGAVKTAAGFVYQEITPGAGATPKVSDTVKVHYKGMLTDGTVFDSSIERGEPAVFPLGQVIPCWTQGLQMMKVGGKSRLVCPSDLAYGDQGRPPKIKPGATLVFEVDLLDIAKP